MLVHAINPHGFAWLRRVTEDNVDLNRNFVDHSPGRYPARPEYDKLHEALLPQQWNDRELADSDALLEAYAAEHGEFALQAAVTGGQYDHADGLFFGGREPVWSNRTFQSVLDAHVVRPRGWWFFTCIPDLARTHTRRCLAASHRGCSPGSVNANPTVAV